MTSPTDDPARWDTCARCPHYRLEHEARSGRCHHVGPDVLNPTPADRCSCKGWRPLTPRRSP